MSWKHGFEMPADVLLDLPQCEAIVTYRDAFHGAEGWCGKRASIFYLIDGETEARCVEHPCDPQEGRVQLDLTWDEYRVAQVMQS